MHKTLLRWIEFGFANLATPTLCPVVGYAPHVEKRAPPGDHGGLVGVEKALKDALVRRTAVHPFVRCRSLWFNCGVGVVVGLCGFCEG